MTNIGQLMKQAQQMQKKMEEMQGKLDQMEVEGQSGGGLVKAKANGKGNILEIQIDPSLLVPDDVEILEDLVVAALNDARTKADQKAQEEMTKITGGMGLPGGMKLPF